MKTEALDLKKNYLVPCSYHLYQRPPEIVRASMQYLFDANDTQYLDFFAGVSVMNCGHCNPQINEAAKAQIDKLQHTTTLYLTRPIGELAEQLAAILPGGIKRSFFCNSGTEANEGAFLAARLFTGRRKIAALTRSLHGRTNLAMSATGIPMWRTDPFLDTAQTAILPGPYDETAGMVTDAAAAASLSTISATLAFRDFAALIIEPIQGNGGIIPLPDKYIQQLRQICTDTGTLLIADEVQTGFARTGTMFAIEQSGVVPDIMTVAKALGNGFPIAAYCTTDTIAQAFTKPSASTLGGNPVSSSAALAVIRYIKKENLVHRAKELGEKLMTGLLELKDRHAIIHDVRGRGLMAGAELYKTDGTPNPEGTDLVLEYAKDHGVLIGKNGLHRNVLAFQPPLIITEENIRRMLSVLDDALTHLSRTSAS